MNIETLLYYKCCHKVYYKNTKKGWKFQALKKCFCQECLAKYNCQTLINQDLARIKVSCKKVSCKRIRVHPKFEWRMDRK